MLSAYANPKYVTEEMVTKYAELGRALGHRGVIVDLALEQPTRGYATPQMLSAITAPTLILQGDKDQLVPPGSALQFASAIKGSRLILYPGVGHETAGGGHRQVCRGRARLHGFVEAEGEETCRADLDQERQRGTQPEHDDLLLTAHAFSEKEESTDWPKARTASRSVVFLPARSAYQLRGREVRDAPKAVLFRAFLRVVRGLFSLAAALRASRG